MTPLPSHKSVNKISLGCADFTAMAEQELSAFFTAVTRLFGSKQAELSAEDWLREFLAIEALPASPREWHALTARVSVHLATRVTASHVLNNLINA